MKCWTVNCWSSPQLQRYKYLCLLQGRTEPAPSKFLPWDLNHQFIKGTPLTKAREEYLYHDFEAVVASPHLSWLSTFLASKGHYRSLHSDHTKSSLHFRFRMASTPFGPAAHFSLSFFIVLSMSSTVMSMSVSCLVAYDAMKARNGAVYGCLGLWIALYVACCCFLHSPSALHVIA